MRRKKMLFIVAIAMELYKMRVEESIIDVEKMEWYALYNIRLTKKL